MEVEVMEKKVTLKDIAEKAGVSTATVSYVVNHRNDQKISEHTKTKVLQICNLLGYSGNTMAKTAANKTNAIGIYLREPSFALAEAEYLYFVNKLSDALKINGFHLVMLPSSYTGDLEHLDAVICFSITKDFFHSIGNNLFIPQIAVDTIIEDSWIFRVYNDFSELLQYPSSKVISLLFESKELRDALQGVRPDVQFVSSFEEINMFLQDNREAHIIAVGDALYQYIKSMHICAKRFSLHTQNKINKIIECIKLGIAHVEVENHDFAL